MKRKGILSGALAGIIALGVSGGCQNNQEVRFGDYSLSSETYNYLTEETVKFNESPASYEEILHFCNKYDKNEDKSLSQKEVERGIEGLVTSVK